MVIMNRKFSSIFGFVSKTDQIIISVRQETGIEYSLGRYHELQSGAQKFSVTEQKPIKRNNQLTTPVDISLATVRFASTYVRWRVHTRVHQRFSILFRFMKRERDEFEKRKIMNRYNSDRIFHYIFLIVYIFLQIDTIIISLG